MGGCQSVCAVTGCLNDVQDKGGHRSMLLILWGTLSTVLDSREDNCHGGDQGQPEQERTG
jgi:hypothetical protein